MPGRLPEIAATATAGAGLSRARQPIFASPWPAGDGAGVGALLRWFQIDGLGTFAALVGLGLEGNAHTFIERANF
jgi:hypothetical protein